jgi:GNAT superfamily N-acetyltransferase
MLVEGYTEWVSSFISAENKIVWFVVNEEKIIGFAACSFNEDQKSCEGVLYGVKKEYAGKGIYSDIIRYTQKYFKDRGYVHMWVSTQLQNYSVQKAWIKEGFSLRKSFETYHINSLLQHPEINQCNT